MKKHNGMRPQDILILLKIITYPGDDWRNYEIANALSMSASEVSEALNRSKIAKLVDVTKRSVNGKALTEFLIYGLKYVFPAEPGRNVRGIPTAHSAQPVKKRITNSRESYVWQYSNGTHRGQAVEPLYKTVPSCVADDKVLYELLVLTDAIRIGRDQVRDIAIDELKKILAFV